MTSSNPAFDEDLLAEFTVEASEAFVEIEGQLLGLEEQFDIAKVDQLFRSIHSIKGAAAFMQLDAIAHLAHSLENVLSRLRQRELVLNRAGVEILLRASDRLREMVQEPAQHAHDDVSAEVDSLAGWEAAQTQTQGAVGAPIPNAEQTLADVEQLVEEVQLVQAASIETGNAKPKRKRAARKSAGKTPDTSNAAETLAQPAAAAAQAVPPATPTTHAPPETASSGQSTGKPSADATIRVSVAVLEELVNLAGELVLSRNQLLRTIPEFRSKVLSSIGARIDQVTTSMQDVIMSARMQPVGLLFNRFPRLVRDLNGKLNKQCKLVLEGTDVELDKTIIEALSDPLTHLIRNSLDHGIELPSQRLEAGKPAEAKLVLSAYHEAGKVHIELIDDGQGIRTEKVLSKAIERQLITPQQAARLDDREVVNLIFLPGFSTAEKVSDVSGRGVGMDVVRTNIERIGGTVDISSVAGQGTTIHIALPLTLAIIPSWIVEQSGYRFALPESAIVEFIGLTRSELQERVDCIDGAKVLRWRDSLLPLIDLKDCLYGLSQAQDSTVREQVEDLTNILVVESGKHIYGLVVEQVCDPEQIVVKPIGRFLREGGYLEGAAVLGDGNMAFVLGLHGIAEKAMLASAGNVTSPLDLGHHAEEGIEAQTALIVRTAHDKLAAVPRMVIQRIERVYLEDLQEVRGRYVYPIRDGQMPVVRVPWIDAEQRVSTSVHYLLVFRLFDQEVGLLVPQIVDIREIPTSVDPRHANQDGVAGTVLIDGRVVEVLDVYELAENLLRLSECQPQTLNKRMQGEQQRSTLLLAEDTPFFRNQIKRFLDLAEYNVLVAEDGIQAWEILDQRAEEVNLVVTDIEMPRMNGFELAKKIRNDERFGNLPIVAITSLHNDEALVRGHAVGIDDWKIKLHRDEMLAAISQQLQSKQRIRVSY